MDMRTVKIEGNALDHLLASLAELNNAGKIHTLRVAVDDEGAKFKVNEGVWSPGIGETVDNTTTRQLRGLADEAYGAALAEDDPARRAYAAGVEDLARYLTGTAAAPALRALLDIVEFKASVPQA